MTEKRCASCYHVDNPPSARPCDRCYWGREQFSEWRSRESAVRVWCLLFQGVGLAIRLLTLNLLIAGLWPAYKTTIWLLNRGKDTVGMIAEWKKSWRAYQKYVKGS